MGKSVHGLTFVKLENDFLARPLFGEVPIAHPGIELPTPYRPQHRSIKDLGRFRLNDLRVFNGAGFTDRKLN